MTCGGSDGSEDKEREERLKLYVQNLFLLLQLLQFLLLPFGS